jgi:hypothetical protein
MAVILATMSKSRMEKYYETAYDRRAEGMKQNKVRRELNGKNENGQH